MPSLGKELALVIDDEKAKFVACRDGWVDR